MFFKDIAGQQLIKDHLLRSVKEDRISHAQLFAGGEGTGIIQMTNTVMYLTSMVCSHLIR